MELNQLYSGKIYISIVPNIYQLFEFEAKVEVIRKALRYRNINWQLIVVVSPSFTLFYRLLCSVQKIRLHTTILCKPEIYNILYQTIIKGQMGEKRKRKIKLKKSTADSMWNNMKSVWAAQLKSSQHSQKSTIQRNNHSITDLTAHLTDQILPLWTRWHDCWKVYVYKDYNWKAG